MIDESPDDVADCAAQAREFLSKAASTWPPATRAGHRKKAGAQLPTWRKPSHWAQGWQYSGDSHFHVVMNRLREIIDDFQIANLHGRAVILHCNGDLRKKHLDADVIAEDLDKMAELLELLSPFTGIAE